MSEPQAPGCDCPGDPDNPHRPHEKECPAHLMQAVPLYTPKRQEKQLRISQAAKRLNVTDKTVRRWIKSGHLKAVNISGGERPTWRIPEGEIDRVLSGDAPTSRNS